MAINVQCTDEVDLPNIGDGVGRAYLTTTDATTATIATLPIAENVTQGFIMHLLARRVDAGIGQAYFSSIQAAFSNVSGTVTAQGLASVVDIANVPIFIAPVILTVSGSNVLVRVTGQLTRIFNWTLSYRYIYVS